jgi:pyridoxamine 5'-phosphate oxidase
MLFSQQEHPSEIWQILKHELHRGALDPKHPFRYVNLGTQTASGPEIRTVVLRSVSKNLEFYVFTDSRSAKVEELRQSPLACLHFYHPGKRVQIRIQAQVQIHSGDELSRAFWAKVKDDAQKAYTSTLASGTVISTPEEAFEWQEPRDDRFFTVLRFVPERVEVLQLNGIHHLRLVFLRSEDWRGSWLVP